MYKAENFFAARPLFFTPDQPHAYLKFFFQKNKVKSHKRKLEEPTEFSYGGSVPLPYLLPLLPFDDDVVVPDLCMPPRPKPDHHRVTAVVVAKGEAAVDQTKCVDDESSSEKPPPPTRLQPFQEAALGDCPSVVRKSEDRNFYKQMQTFFSLKTTILQDWAQRMIQKKKWEDAEEEEEEKEREREEKEAVGLFSGRLLEYFFINYAKENDIRYYLWIPRLKNLKPNCNLQSFKNVAFCSSGSEEYGGKEAETLRVESQQQPATFYFSSFSELQKAREENNQELLLRDWLEIDVKLEYTHMMNRYSKVNFDMFRRGEKFLFTWYDNSSSFSSASKSKFSKICTLETTLCQLRFFWWAACIALPSYWNDNYQKVRSSSEAAIGLENKKKEEQNKKNHHNAPQKIRAYEQKQNTEQLKNTRVENQCSVVVENKNNKLLCKKQKQIYTFQQLSLFYKTNGNG